MLDNVGLRYPHRASGAKAPRTLRPLPLLRFAVSATGGAHLCSIQYYLRFCLGSCRTSLAVSALRIMRYCFCFSGTMLRGYYRCFRMPSRGYLPIRWCRNLQAHQGPELPLRWVPGSVPGSVPALQHWGPVRRSGCSSRSGSHAPGHSHTRSYNPCWNPHCSGSRCSPAPCRWGAMISLQ